MSFPAVLERGDDFLSEYPRRSKAWAFISHAACVLVVGGSKLVLNIAYRPEVTGLEKLDAALERSKRENRGIITVMNHMSVVDDPFLWGCLPWKYFRDVDVIRWGLAASNVCFKGTFLSYFFSAGKILSTERFGRGPFQPSLDATVRLLSPDDTMDPEFMFFPSPKASLLPWIKSPLTQKIKEIDSKPYHPPVMRHCPSWIHVFPEGFVCQLQPPHSNSMRYFRWGASRLVLEPTVPPIVVPIFSTGFEMIQPESGAENIFERYLPQNYGQEIKVVIGDPVDDKVIEDFRKEWKNLCEKKYDRNNPRDLSHELKFGKQAKDLRSRVAAELRQNVLKIRNQLGFNPEDPRLKDPKFWKRYTNSKGLSDPDIKFIGKNWAVKEYQAKVKSYDEFGNEIKDDQR
ncbi:hypothetical protein LJB42_003865 [Komagataella kurtzmanii]|nr:hypothetical protein LJB42_003865 [Komagataella kurtzmanii]